MYIGFCESCDRPQPTILQSVTLLPTEQVLIQQLVNGSRDITLKDIKVGDVLTIKSAASRSSAYVAANTRNAIHLDGWNIDGGVEEEVSGIHLELSRGIFYPGTRLQAVAQNTKISFQSMEIMSSNTLVTIPGVSTIRSLIVNNDNVLLQGFFADKISTSCDIAALTIKNFGSLVTCQDCDFKQNVFSLSVQSSAQVILQDSIVRNGGGASAACSTVHVTTGGSLFTNSTQFLDNVVSSSGGAVHVSKESMFETLLSTFSRNVAYISGGAIACDDPSATISLQSTMLNHNRARDQGGGALWFHQATVNVTSSTFRYNEGNGYGGAIEVGRGGHLNVAGSEFNANQDIRGGAIALRNKASAVIKVSSFHENSGFQGAALYLLDESSVIVDGSQMSRGMATEGAALYISTTCTALIKSTRIIDGSASTAGGGVVVTKN